MTSMTLSAEALAMMNRDPDFNSALAKSQPGVGDVHVSSAPAKPKPLTFLEGIEEVPDATDDLAKIIGGDLKDFSFDSVLSGLPTQLQAALKAAPALKPHPDGGAHTPFPYDAQALDRIEGKHMRRFLGALTSPDDLPTRSIPVKSLVSIQPRVSPEKVESMRTNGYDKQPTVVRHSGKNLLVDGTHRGAASLLDGDTAIDCKYLRLSGEDGELLKIEEAEFRFVIKEADPKQQMIFGWASIVMKGDRLVIDKQGDMILPEDMEPAVYDFVLEKRDHGHKHQVLGTGRLIESMWFSKEKQDLLGIVIKDDAGAQIVGWWTGFKVDAPDVWAAHERGELPEFSIGGLSMSTPM